MQMPSCLDCGTDVDRQSLRCRPCFHLSSRTTYDKNYVLGRIKVDGEGCWIWQGATNAYGYGAVSRKSGEGYAHRLAYLLWVGPAGSLDVDHLCGVPGCVNPDHLEAVTHQENMRRSGKHRQRRTHCSKGHPFTSIATNSDGSFKQNVCKTCANQRSREARARARRERAA